METTPRTAGVEPTIGAAAAHLAVDDDATGPGSVPLVAVLARDPGGLAGDVGEQGLDVAPPCQVQDLFWTALLGKALAGLAGQPLGEGALDVELAVAGLSRKLLGRLNHWLLHLLVPRLHLLWRVHLRRRLVLVLLLVLMLLLLVLVLVLGLVLLLMRRLGVLVRGLSVLGMCKALLHVVQLVLDGLGHGVARGTGSAVR